MAEYSIQSTKSDKPDKRSKPDKQETPVCPYCQRQFRSLDELTLHIVTRHTQSGKPSDKPEPATTAG